MKTTKWVLDPSHSELLFRVKHLMITNVKGVFRKFDAEVLSDGYDFSHASVNVTIDAGSIFTNEEKRDAHLKSADFFDVENFRELTFKSTDITKNADGSMVLKGMLTIRGISKEVSLDVESGGIIKDPWGNEKAGFALNGRINRLDWGLNWNAVLETGGVLVSDEVRIQSEVELVRQN